MSRNPYLDQLSEPPKQSYTLRLRNTDLEIQVNPNNLPDEHCDGLEGSILAILLDKGIDIYHSCGGVVGCSTCHIYVHTGLETGPEPIEEEEDQLDFAPAVQDNSRLACCFVPDGSEDVEVEIPQWNRNAVSEDH
jgi:2Fe-2S ferredoxin